MISGLLFWFSDEAWAAIDPHLLKNQPGARRVATCYDKFAASFATALAAVVAF